MNFIKNMVLIVMFLMPTFLQAHGHNHHSSGLQNFIGQEVIRHSKDILRLIPGMIASEWLLFSQKIDDEMTEWSKIKKKQDELTRVFSAGFVQSCESRPNNKDEDTNQGDSSNNDEDDIFCNKFLFIKQRVPILATQLGCGLLGAYVTNESMVDMFGQQVLLGINQESSIFLSDEEMFQVSLSNLVAKLTLFARASLSACHYEFRKDYFAGKIKSYDWHKIGVTVVGSLLKEYIVSCIQKDIAHKIQDFRRIA